MGWSARIQALVSKHLLCESEITDTPSFSFDMSGFNNPDQFITFLQSYVTNEAYFTYNSNVIYSGFDFVTD
jgi:hypothetical protein